MGQVIQLTTVQPLFDAVWNGTKTAVIQPNARDYKVGDLLELKEYDLVKNKFGERIIPVLITHVLKADHQHHWGLREGFVMLSFKVMA